MAVVQEGSHGGLDDGSRDGKTWIYLGGSSVLPSVSMAVGCGEGIYSQMIPNFMGWNHVHEAIY